MGLSRLLEGLLRQAAPGLTVLSAGITIDEDDRGLDEDARQALTEVGARCDGDPHQLTPSLADDADVVIVLGNIDVSDYIAPDVKTERWMYEDPAEKGIYGVERYVQLRDELYQRVTELAKRFAP